MYRSLLPFILAGLGFTLVALAINMPLFEWEISEMVTDFPPEVRFNPSPWTTKLGESLDDDSYIQVYVSNAVIACRPERLTAVIKRSRNHEALEQIALNINQNIIPWLSEWSKFGLILFLCGIYIWWATVWYKRPISEALISTFVAVIVLGILINIWRLFFHNKIGSPVCLGLDGTLTLNARLSRIHHETLGVLLLGILSELAVFGMMLRQIISVVMKGRSSSEKD